MLRRLRRAIPIALVPVLAFAAPKHHTPSRPKSTPPKPDTGSGSDTKPAEPADAPADKAPADKAPAPSPAAATPSPAAGSAAPAAPAAAEAPPPANEPEPAVDALRQEYLTLRDELFKSRARANAVASALYSTRIQIKLTWGSARYYGVSKASIRLDGAQVYEDTAGAISGDDGVRFDGFVAPGRHLITFHLEATGKDDDSFTSSTETQVVVKAVANKDLLVAAKGRDSGDIAYQWKKTEHGSYGLGLDVGVKTVAHAEAKAK